MAGVFIYNAHWLNETRQRLQQEQRQMLLLREMLEHIRAQFPEYAAIIAPTVMRTDELTRKLQETQDALALFQEDVETHNQRTLSSYQKFLEPQRIFS